MCSAFALSVCVHTGTNIVRPGAAAVTGAQGVRDDSSSFVLVDGRGIRGVVRTGEPSCWCPTGPCHRRRRRRRRSSANIRMYYPKLKASCAPDLWKCK